MPLRNHQLKNLTLLILTSTNEDSNTKNCMAKQNNVFVGSKVTLVPAHDSTKGEVRSKVFGSLFLVIILQIYSNHEKLL